jgi:cyclic beta-1,2-glucan synthetase
MLALDIDPTAAIKNLRWMARKGWFAKYGFYEAADFSPDVRPSRRLRYALVRSWMVHHQGMSLLAIANFLNDGMVQNWFHRHARVKATELLLQERPVRRAPSSPPKSKKQRARAAARVPVIPKETQVA